MFDALAVLLSAAAGAACTAAGRRLYRCYSEYQARRAYAPYYRWLKGINNATH